MFYDLNNLDMLFDDWHFNLTTEIEARNEKQNLGKTSFIGPLM